LFKGKIRIIKNHGYIIWTIDCLTNAVIYLSVSSDCDNS